MIELFFILAPSSFILLFARVVQLAGDDRFKICNAWVQIPHALPKRFSDLDFKLRSLHPPSFAVDITNQKSQIGQSKMFLWVVAQSAEHRTVTVAREGSTPFDPPNFNK